MSILWKIYFHWYVDQQYILMKWKSTNIINYAQIDSTAAEFVNINILSIFLSEKKASFPFMERKKIIHDIPSQWY